MMHPVFLRILVVTTVVAILAGCSLFGTASSGEVTGEADPPLLVLTNTMRQPAHYVVFETTSASRVDLDLGDVRDWPTIGPGQSVKIPFDQIALYEDGDPSVWVRWETEDRGDSFVVELQ